MAQIRFYSTVNFIYYLSIKTGCRVNGKHGKNPAVRILEQLKKIQTRYSLRTTREWSSWAYRHYYLSIPSEMCFRYVFENTHSCYDSIRRNAIFEMCLDGLCVRNDDTCLWDRLMRRLQLQMQSRSVLAMRQQIALIQETLPTKCFVGILHPTKLDIQDTHNTHTSVKITLKKQCVVSDKVRLSANERGRQRCLCSALNLGIRRWTNCVANKLSHDVRSFNETKKKKITEKRTGNHSATSNLSNCN